MEHAAHAGGHGDHGHGGGGGKGKASFGTKVGLTMAMLGVLLAFTGALVGAARTELTSALTLQNISQTKFQGNAARYRTLHTSMRNLYSRTAPAEQVKALADGFAALEPQITDPQAKAQFASLKLMSSGLIGLMDPNRVEMRKMMWTAKKFRIERDMAGVWSDAYIPLVHDHFESAEHFEWSQLLAEIGIVIASIALLTQSKKMWFASLGLGGLSLGIVIWTHLTIKSEIHHHEAAIDAAQEKFFELKKTQDETADDDALFTDMEKRFPQLEGEPEDGLSKLNEQQKESKAEVQQMKDHK